MQVEMASSRWRIGYISIAPLCKQHREAHVRFSPRCRKRVADSNMLGSSRLDRPDNLRRPGMGKGTSTMVSLRTMQLHQVLSLQGRRRLNQCLHPSNQPHPNRSLRLLQPQAAPLQERKPILIPTESLRCTHIAFYQNSG